jgi:hypothetical protein
MFWFKIFAYLMTSNRCKIFKIRRSDIFISFLSIFSNFWAKVEIEDLMFSVNGTNQGTFDKYLRLEVNSLSSSRYTGSSVWTQSFGIIEPMWILSSFKCWSESRPNAQQNSDISRGRRISINVLFLLLFLSVLMSKILIFLAIKLATLVITIVCKIKLIL